MKQLNWQVAKTLTYNQEPNEWINATVPGAAQLDYARHNNFADYKYSDNFHQFDGLEDSFWTYRAQLPDNCKDSRTIFYCGGIDYEFEIFCLGKKLLYYEGMFAPVNIDLTDYIACGAKEIIIKVFPTPKRKGAPVGRWEADNCAKPAVSYSWDWHPRLISQGIWKDTYIEYVPSDYIKDIDISYVLTDALDSVTVSVEVTGSGAGAAKIEILDKNGAVAGAGKAEGGKAEIVIANPNLWWPIRQGEQYLYTVKASLDSGSLRTRRLGFKRSKLVTQEFNWWIDKFPFTQAKPPITLEINGRQIFAKGSNWVNPEIFVGTITRETYEPLIDLAVKSNMNIFRCWGGAIVNKDEFFELCDEKGIMVWQEFPLACNCYKDEPHYISVLEKEATSIIKALRTHPSVVLWCGGNELYTGGSSMTEQFHALRLLNSLCYRLDKYTAFIYTSPIMGMRHGHYIFKFSDGKDCFNAFQTTDATAFTEFGCPAPSEYEYLKTFIPPEELELDNLGKSWEAHHGIKAWEDTSWLCRPIIEGYFGKSKNLKQLIERGKVLSRNGYKAMFEEARRQKPNCQMAVNWCFNEPWPSAANNSLVNYPCVPRDNLNHVTISLKDRVLSARVPKFSYRAGELFSAETFLLNDVYGKYKSVQMRAYIQMGNERVDILQHTFAAPAPNANVIGAVAKCVLPEFKESGLMKLVLECDGDISLNNSYEFLYYNAQASEKISKKNMCMDFVGINENTGDCSELEI